MLEFTVSQMQKIAIFKDAAVGQYDRLLVGSGAMQVGTLLRGEAASRVLVG